MSGVFLSLLDIFLIIVFFGGNERCEMHKGVLYENDATRFKKGRKLIASILQPRELQACRPVLHEQVVHFLNNLLKEPSRFLAHIRK